MAFSRGAKYPVEFFCRQWSTSSRQFGNTFSSQACRVPHNTELRDVNSFFSSNHGSTNFASVRKMFLRSFSVATSASEQMNLIKQLRERTRAPIKDVKASLVKCNWDIDAAQTDLIKTCITLACKKSSRTAAEGRLALAQNDEKAAVIELNCETDFGARLAIFQHLAISLAEVALSVESSANQVSIALPIGPELLEELKIDLYPHLSGEISVRNAITEVAAKMGENVKLRRGYIVSKSSSGVISSYLHICPYHPIHFFGVGQLAGILTLEIEGGNCSLDILQEVGSQLAMHIVAAKPLFLSKDLVSSEALESERDILKTQAETTGKPKMAIEKMVERRMRKYFEKVVLLEQKFIENNSINIKSVLDELSKEVGVPVKVGKFLRMEVGEGIQREEASGTTEVVAQAA